MTAISSRFAGNKNDTKESLLDSNITCMLIVSEKRACFFFLRVKPADVADPTFLNPNKILRRVKIYLFSFYLPVE